jgi:hypothetical protein
LPLFSFPDLRRVIALSTSFDELLEYLAISSPFCAPTTRRVRRTPYALCKLRAALGVAAAWVRQRIAKARLSVFLYRRPRRGPMPKSPRLGPGLACSLRNQCCIRLVLEAD